MDGKVGDFNGALSLLQSNYGVKLQDVQEKINNFNHPVAGGGATGGPQQQTPDARATTGGSLPNNSFAATEQFSTSQIPPYPYSSTLVQHLQPGHCPTMNNSVQPCVPNAGDNLYNNGATGQMQMGGTQPPLPLCPSLNHSLPQVQMNSMTGNLYPTQTRGLYPSLEQPVFKKEYWNDPAFAPQNRQPYSGSMAASGTQAIWPINDYGGQSQSAANPMINPSWPNSSNLLVSHSNGTGLTLPARQPTYSRTYTPALTSDPPREAAGTFRVCSLSSGDREDVHLEIEFSRLGNIVIIRDLMRAYFQVANDKEIVLTDANNQPVNFNLVDTPEKLQSLAKSGAFSATFVNQEPIDPFSPTEVTVYATYGHHTFQDVKFAFSEFKHVNNIVTTLREKYSAIGNSEIEIWIGGQKVDFNQIDTVFRFGQILGNNKIEIRVFDSPQRS